MLSAWVCSLSFLVCLYTQLSTGLLLTAHCSSAVCKACVWWIRRVDDGVAAMGTHGLMVCCPHGGINQHGAAKGGHDLEEAMSSCSSS